MKNLNIGIDIDQTMYFLNIVEEVSNLLGLNFSSKQIKHWKYDKDINGLPSWFVKIMYAYFYNAKYMGSLKIYPHVKEKLKELKTKGHKLHVITARHTTTTIETIRMLNIDFGIGFFDSINFVECLTNEKTKLFKELNLDVWIDDNPKDIKNAIDMGIDTYAIYNDNTKYNRTMLSKLIDDKTKKGKLKIAFNFKNILVE